MSISSDHDTLARETQVVDWSTLLEQSNAVWWRHIVNHRQRFTDSESESDDQWFCTSSSLDFIIYDADDVEPEENDMDEKIDVSQWTMDEGTTTCDEDDNEETNNETLAEGVNTQRWYGLGWMTRDDFVSVLLHRWMDQHQKERVAFGGSDVQDVISAFLGD